MTDYPITPPQWQMDAWQARIETMGADVPAILLEAAQWGADQELEACCEWLKADPELVDEFRAHRRPKPPSLKEQALDDLCIAFDRGCLSEIQADTIRRALEQLPDCE
jgi:hypothetical protein